MTDTPNSSSHDPDNHLEQTSHFARRTVNYNNPSLTRETYSNRKNSRYSTGSDNSLVQRLRYQNGTEYKQKPIGASPRGTGNHTPTGPPSTIHSLTSEHHLPSQSDLTQLEQDLDAQGFKLIIENTQRSIIPKDLSKPPEKGSEIFIGKLPRDVFEAELFPLVQAYGSVLEFRIMLDYNAYNRGFSFVTYETRSQASAALKALNNHEIRQGKMLGVCRSVDNCRLFVGGIPKTKVKSEILEEMKKVSDGVVNVIVYPSASDKSKNRGFAFIEYESHKAAAMSRRKLMNSKISMWGQPIAVDWAEPEIDVDDDIMATVKVLYVRNLMLNTREDTLENLFEGITGKASIERVKKIRDYAFVHFNSRANAETAMKELNGTDLDGSRIEVTWAKPVDREAYAKYNKNTRPQNSELLTSPHHHTADSVYNPIFMDPHHLGLPQSYNGYIVSPGHAITPAQRSAFPIIMQSALPTYTPNYQPQQIPTVAGVSDHATHNSTHYSSSRNKPRGAGGMRAVGSRAYLSSQVRPGAASHRADVENNHDIFEHSVDSNACMTNGVHADQGVVPTSESVGYTAGASGLLPDVKENAFSRQMQYIQNGQLYAATPVLNQVIYPGGRNIGHSGVGGGETAGQVPMANVGGVPLMYVQPAQALQQQNYLTASNGMVSRQNYPLVVQPAMPVSYQNNSSQPVVAPGYVSGNVQRIGSNTTVGPVGSTSLGSEEGKDGKLFIS